MALVIVRAEPEGFQDVRLRGLRLAAIHAGRRKACVGVCEVPVEVQSALIFRQALWHPVSERVGLGEGQVRHGMIGRELQRADRIASASAKEVSWPSAVKASAMARALYWDSAASASTLLASSSSALSNRRLA